MKAVDMNANEIKRCVGRILAEIMAVKGLKAPQLAGDTVLLGGSLGIDSLDLAALVVNLTQISQKDPFAEGFIEFRTVGELVRLYAD
jgi:acyl carrier protein